MARARAAAALGAALSVGFAAGDPKPVIEVYMYRAMALHGDVPYAMSSVNLGDLQGVMQYVHREIITDHQLSDAAEKTERKYGINTILRYRVLVRNPEAPQINELDEFVTYDYGQATNTNQWLKFSSFGDFVGMQIQSPVFVNYPDPYYWFSLSGPCPSLPYALGIETALCSETGGDSCPSKDSAEEGCQDLAVHRGPQHCLCYESSQETVRGGLCNAPADGGQPTSVEEPTGSHGCVYSYDAAPTIVNWDEVTGITAQLCKETPDSPSVPCRDWEDFRHHCADPSLKRTFTSMGHIHEVSYCVEYDLNPDCAGGPRGCSNTFCTRLADDQKELGLPFWRGRCDPDANRRRAEALAAAFEVPGAQTAHKIRTPPSADFLDVSCSHMPNRQCTPSGSAITGDLLCTREWSGVCTSCRIPGTMRASANQNTPLCPWSVAQIGDYQHIFAGDRPGSNCRTHLADNICCLYTDSCTDMQLADAPDALVNLAIDDAGGPASFAYVAAAQAIQPPEGSGGSLMERFMIRVARERVGVGEDVIAEMADEIQDFAYWSWTIGPPLQYMIESGNHVTQDFPALVTRLQMLVDPRDTCAAEDCTVGHGPLSQQPPFCGSGECTEEECCEALGQCADDACTTGFAVLDPQPEYCRGPACSLSECCEALAECSSETCTAGFSALESPPDYCAGAACEVAECCEALGQCEEEDCVSGYGILSSPPQHCAGATCTQDECCQALGTCTPEVCEDTAGAVLFNLRQPYCAGLACTFFECCITRASCSSNGMECTPGHTRLSTPPLWCDGTTCTLSECCEASTTSTETPGATTQAPASTTTTQAPGATSQAPASTTTTQAPGATSQAPAPEGDATTTVAAGDAGDDDGDGGRRCDDNGCWYPQESWYEVVAVSGAFMISFAGAARGDSAAYLAAESRAPDGMAGTIARVLGVNATLHVRDVTLAPFEPPSDLIARRLASVAQTRWRCGTMELVLGSVCVGYIVDVPAARNTTALAQAQNTTDIWVQMHWGFPALFGSGGPYTHLMTVGAASAERRVQGSALQAYDSIGIRYCTGPTFTSPTCVADADACADICTQQNCDCGILGRDCRGRDCGDLGRDCQGFMVEVPDAGSTEPCLGDHPDARWCRIATQWQPPPAGLVVPDSPTVNCFRQLGWEPPTSPPADHTEAPPSSELEDPDESGGWAFLIMLTLLSCCCFIVLAGGCLHQNVGGSADKVLDNVSPETAAHFHNVGIVGGGGGDASLKDSSIELPSLKDEDHTSIANHDAEQGPLDMGSFTGSGSLELGRASHAAKD